MNEHGISVVSEAELRQVVGVDASMIDAVEAAFVWAAQGRAQSPPVMHIAVAEHNGDVDIKSAYIRGEDFFAVKIAAGFYDNWTRGLPTGSGLVVLIDSRTGRPAVVFIDNGYLTDLRTAAAGAIAAKYLASATSTRVGIVGCGAQARFQLRAIAAIRDVREVFVSARSQEKASRYATEMSQELSIPVSSVSIKTLAAASDIIVTTTPSQAPVLHGAMLRPGQTIIAMGSDAPSKRELDAAVFSKAALIVCDNLKQCELIGELHHALAEQTIFPDLAVVELGDVVTKRHPGRSNDNEIIVCDLTGMGAQDSAIGLYARQRVLDMRLRWPTAANDP